jgi:hypothetical protein
MSLYVHRGEGWVKFEYVGRGVVWSRVYAVIDRERERKGKREKERESERERERQRAYTQMY